MEENLDLDDRDLEQNNDLRETKRSMFMRQKVYEEMADKQLEEIIATMMSVSNVVEPETEEDTEEQHSFDIYERSSIALSRKDSETLVIEKFTLEV